MPDPIPGRDPSAFWDLSTNGWPNLVTSNSLRRVREHIPDLKTALEMWRDQDDDSLYRDRFMVALPRAHMAPQFIQLLYSWLDSNGLPYYVYTHDSSQSVAEKQAILAQHAKEIYQALGIRELPQPLKTVTLGYSNAGTSYYLLVSGVGDFKIEKELRKEIAEAVQVSNSVMKAASINPREFDTTIRLGLIPGIVSPILEQHLAGNINGIYYLKPKRPDHFVELAVSPIDSFILRSGEFTEHLKGYAEKAYHEYEITEAPNHIYFRNTSGLSK